MAAAASGDRIDWLGVLAVAWALHIAVDRALGHGLKTTRGFEHTHLGRIVGRGVPARPPTAPVTGGPTGSSRSSAAPSTHGRRT
nr:DUF4260 family protein [Micromonospora marina]